MLPHATASCVDAQARVRETARDDDLKCCTALLAIVAPYDRSQAASSRGRWDGHRGVYTHIHTRTVSASTGNERRGVRFTHRAKTTQQHISSCKDSDNHSAHYKQNASYKNTSDSHSTHVSPRLVPVTSRGKLFHHLCTERTRALNRNARQCFTLVYLPR